MNPSPPLPSPSLSCPCGLTYDILDKHNLVGPGGKCTALYADKSGNICGKPLGAHPRLSQIAGALDSLSQIGWSLTSTASRDLYLVSGRIKDCQKYSGYRKKFFEDAQHFRAYYDVRNPSQSIWYPEGSDDLHISLMFGSTSDAHDFLAQLSNYSFYQKFRGGIEFDESFQTLSVPATSECKFVFLHHYDPQTSTSRANSLDDSIHYSETTTNDGDLEKMLTSVEDLTQLAPKEKIFRCHIAPQAYYTDFKNDKSNIIFGSFLFHGYFDGDGKRPPCHANVDWGDPPELALLFIQADSPQYFSGTQYSRINVHIIFRDPAIAKAMDGRWRTGTEFVNELTMRTYFYSRNAESTIMFLRIKYFETERRWKHCDGEEVDFTEEWNPPPPSNLPPATPPSVDQSSTCLVSPSLISSVLF